MHAIILSTVMLSIFDRVDEKSRKPGGEGEGKKCIRIENFKTEKLRIPTQNCFLYRDRDLLPATCGKTLDTTPAGAHDVDNMRYDERKSCGTV